MKLFEARSRDVVIRLPQLSRRCHELLRESLRVTRRQKHFDCLSFVGWRDR